MPEPRPKQKYRRPEPRKHTKDPLLVFSLIFLGTMRLLKFFGLHQRVPSSFVSIFCNTMDVKKKTNRCLKIPNVPHIFRHKIPFLKLFSEILSKSPKGYPLNFFHILQPTGVPQSPKAPPLQFGALDIAPTLAVPCMFQIDMEIEISVTGRK